MIKVAILTLSTRINNNTGDVMQANKTAEALRQKGIFVEHLLLYLPDVLVKKDSNEPLSLDYVNNNYNIVHSIPPIPDMYLKKIRRRLAPKLAVSTIFWRSVLSTKVLSQASGRVNFRSILNDFLVMFKIKPVLSYRHYDLLLPNSQTEISQFNRYCQRKKNSKIFAVPNAVGIIPEWAYNVKRFNFLPSGDYILYPGIFAYRKNQLNFIRAMKNIKTPVVFMGDVLNEDYYLKCKSEASESMLFLGHIQHGSEEFYSCLKHASIACLASDCETPGIALLEAAAFGARPVITKEGGTIEYYSWDAEYLNPLSESSIRNAVLSGWERGKLNDHEQCRYRELSWEKTAKFTINAYQNLLKKAD